MTGSGTTEEKRKTCWLCRRLKSSTEISSLDIYREMMDGRFYREGDEFHVLMSVEFEVSVEGY